MYWAARHGNVPAVRACLESGVDVNKVLTPENRTALHVAAELGQAAVVKALIEAGADVNKPSSPILRVDGRRTPQRYACVPRRCQRPHARRHGAHNGGRGCEPGEGGRVYPTLHGSSKMDTKDVWPRLSKPVQTFTKPPIMVGRRWLLP